MIDYSVYKKMNPMDAAAEPKAYAAAQMRENMSFSDFVNHIAGHNGVFSRGTVRGVLSDACLCIVEQLLNGNKVQLGELGDFWISLSSTGADSLESFSASAGHHKDLRTGRFWCEPSVARQPLHHSRWRTIVPY